MKTIIDSNLLMTQSSTDQFGDKFPVIFICGPTAVGKTALSIKVAKEFDGEIISADSRQFYKELTIGTAKVTQSEMDGVPHHFIDSLSITENYTAGKFGEDALAIIQAIHQKGKLPVVVGGSGLYIKALIEGLDNLPSDEALRTLLNKRFENEGLQPLIEELKEKDPSYFEKADIQNPVRVIRALEIIELTGIPVTQQQSSSSKNRPFHPIVIGLNRERSDLYKAIDQRVDQMIDAGLVEEARTVAEFEGSQALQTVGYQELFPYFRNEASLEDSIELIKRNSRRYAKRQLTWLRKMENVNWFDAGQSADACRWIAEKIASKN